MSTYNRYTYVATYGDRAVKTGGEAVRICPVGTCPSPYNVYTGEAVVYNPRTNRSLAPADVASASHIAFAIGVGKKGHLADDLLHIFGDGGQLKSCDLQLKAEVTPPCCGIPQIVDIFFDCVKCDKVYTLELLLDDSLVRSRYGRNEKAKYIFQAVTECCSCDDCDPSSNCEEVACKLIDAINGTVQTDPTKVTRFVRASIEHQYQPFRAARLYLQDTAASDLTSHIFCLDPQSDVCADCSYMDAITGVQVDGTDYLFDYTVLPDDPSRTGHEQVDRIICSINNVLGNLGGSAHLQRGIGQCCPYTIEINSCQPGINLLGLASVVIPPKISRSPFSSKQIEQICKGCGTTADKITLGCGIRVFVHPVKVPCNCQYPPHLASPNMYTRTVEAQFVGEGWVCKNFHSFTSQDAERPEGFGYYYQDMAVHKNHNGGSGRDYRYSNILRGKVVPLPDEHSNFTNAANNWVCEDTYCVFNLMQQKVAKGFMNNALVWSNSNPTWLGIPDKDSTTLSSVTDYLVEFQRLGQCSSGNLICLKAANDTIVAAATVGAVSVIDVTTNDPDFATPCTGAIDWTYGQVVNATVVNNADGTFDVTPIAEGDFGFSYSVYCTDIDGNRNKISSASFTGAAEV